MARMTLKPSRFRHLFSRSRTTTRHCARWRSVWNLVPAYCLHTCRRLSARSTTGTLSSNLALSSIDRWVNRRCCFSVDSTSRFPTLWVGLLHYPATQPPQAAHGGRWGQDGPRTQMPRWGQEDARWVWQTHKRMENRQTNFPHIIVRLIIRVVND